MKDHRINSIDALRAIVLLGIFLEHIKLGFCVTMSNVSYSFFDIILDKFIGKFLLYKDIGIFSILFGVSFYILMQKKDYNSSKFIWRCIILIFFGIINKFFFYSDILMIYGICGIILTFCRKFTDKQLLFTIILLYILSNITTHLNFTKVCSISTDIDRYKYGVTITEILKWWPFAIIHHLTNSLCGPIYKILANFILGYFIAKIGFIYKMDKCIKLKHCIILFAFYLILELLLFIKFNVPLFFDIYIIHTSLFYSSIFIWVYNNVRILKKPFEYLESYGKCGLTNYCMQGYFAVIFLCHLGFSYTEHSFSFYIFVTLSFFLLQSILSYLWLKSYRNGPFEYIWRCLTVFKMLPFKRNYE